MANTEYLVLFIGPFPNDPKTISIKHYNCKKISSNTAVFHVNFNIWSTNLRNINKNECWWSQSVKL